MARLIALGHMRPQGRRGGWHGSVWCSTVLGVMVLTACSDLVGTPALPAGTEDPATYNTAAGAVSQAAAATTMLQVALADFTIVSGLLTDELTNSDPAASSENIVDTRTLPEVGGYNTSSSFPQDYIRLQRLRGQAQQARGMILKYVPDQSPAVRGQLYAFEAYADILLADLFCSGVPLSTLDFEKDFTYQPSSSTAEIYRHANALLDTALTLVADSADLQTLVKVSKGRALLALGEYDAAAAAVAAVPDDAAYRMKVTFTGNSDEIAPVASVADGEGGTGLRYVSSRDPRTASDRVMLRVYSHNLTVNYPHKYNPYPSAQPTNGLRYYVSFVLADGIEARLIESEAALHRGEGSLWLQTLNHLRTTGAYTRIDTAFRFDTTGTQVDTTVARVDTLWSAGTGGVAGLGPLTDPGTLNARVDLVFAERAAWLFLTGHREGDLRRLIRQYGRTQDQVYPTGPYTSGPTSFGVYGSDVNAPIPASESINPLFHGCLNREA